jgi:ABC-type transport system involved in cytochrome bd biosynthesis fused ATPase/permease subunit
VKIKVAVTKTSGAAKSSLINVMRGINPSNKNAAKEGIKKQRE